MRSSYYGCCFLLMLLLGACGSSKKYKLLESNQEALQLQLDSSRSQLAQLLREEKSKQQQQEEQLAQAVAAQKQAEKARQNSLQQLAETQKAKTACEQQLAQSEKALQIFQAQLGKEARKKTELVLAEERILEQLKAYKGLEFERISASQALKIACPDSLLFRGENSVQNSAIPFLKDLASLLSEEENWELELLATADRGSKAKVRLAQATTRANSVASKLRILKLSLSRLYVSAWAKEDEIPLYIYIFPKGRP